MGRQRQRQRERRRQKQRGARSASPQQKTAQPASRPSTQRVPGQTRRQPAPRTLGAGTIAVVVAVVVLAVAGFAFAASRGLGSSSSPTPTPVAYTRPVDGIQCGAMEQLAYHIHQYLELYNHGRAVPVPAYIGIPGGDTNFQCFYWIHVHAETPDIIHVESPTLKTYTLGNFFDIWAATKDTASPPGDAFVQQLKATPQNDITVFVNGKRWNAGYRTVPLKEHEVIAVEIGKPVVPPKPYTNWQGL